jgi:hypothetical protein
MTAIRQWLKNISFTYASIYTLVSFRILFGLMLFFSTLRFILNGWVNDLYITPKFYFTYYGFDWVHPLSPLGMQLLFGLLIILSLFISLGLFYRLSTTAFFCIFTYIELIDKTNYLNHYYFISLISFLLIFLPAHQYFSIDTYIGITKKTKKVHAWTINILKFQLAVVYIYAGISKLNYHWLIEAQPLSNWLKHQSDLPLIGGLMEYDFTAYVFSWGGALFDLCIPFILLNRKYRLFGYALVVFFHVLTSLMFPIGVFPFVMIVSTLIFFSEGFHEKLISGVQKIIPFRFEMRNPKLILPPSKKSRKILSSLLGLYITIQLLVPMRYLFYDGKLFWNEQGYRFSWRVMLIEKAGYTQFYIHDQIGRKKLIDNSTYLTKQQEKMMSTQPDMILQYAHHLRDEYSDTLIIEGKEKIYLKIPKVTADIRVALFNKGNRQFIDPNMNLSNVKRGLHQKKWVLDYEE